MKPILFICLAILAISLGATGISIAFMPLKSSWIARGIFTEFVTHHADWPTAKALFLSYLLFFSGIILSIKYIANLSSKD